MFLSNFFKAAAISSLVGSLIIQSNINFTSLSATHSHLLPSAFLNVPNVVETYDGETKIVRTFCSSPLGNNTRHLWAEE